MAESQIQRTARTTHPGSDDAGVRIPVVEERAAVETRLVDLGYVEIRKTVITEQAMVPVELRREEVEFRRVDAEDGAIPVTDAPGAFDGTALRIAMPRERAVAHKEVVVTAEVVVGRTRMFEYVDVGAPVRCERITVDGEVARGAAAARGPVSHPATFSAPGGILEPPAMRRANRGSRDDGRPS